MQVLKFGGTSVANAKNIKRLKEIVETKGDKETIVVVSALGGVTDLLLQCGQMAANGEEGYKAIMLQISTRHAEVITDLLPTGDKSKVSGIIAQYLEEAGNICHGIFLLRDLSERTKDRMVSYGELMSSQIIAAYFSSEGMKNTWKDSRELIRTDSQYAKASVQWEKTYSAIQSFFLKREDQLYVLPGFIAMDDKGHTTTLGRGGSDYTAAIIGAGVNASAVEIWTDVSGIMTADPRMVNNAKAIAQISYHDAMELSHFGAKVIYPPTIQPLMQKKIPVWVKNSFAPEAVGSLIQADVPRDGDIITGISSINSIALLSLEGSGMVGIPGFSRRLFEALAAHRINVILITQASSEHTICVGVDEHASEQAKEVIDAAFSVEIEKGDVNPLGVETGLSIIALVGDKMRSHPGTCGRMFSALGRNGVNIRAIAQGSSERNISAVIGTADIKKALNVLHEEFFETTYKQINLFIAGTGNVGAKLLKQLQQQQEYLQKNLRLQVCIAGLLNSRKMVLKDEGVDLQNWQEVLNEGETSNIEQFLDRMRTKNLRNSVFVDVTANEAVAMNYKKVFEKSISIVACNKIACSSPYSYYKELKDEARDHNASFLFETNVGAGLPVIGTLNDLLRSGDKVNRIQAVLSGTLNFVFNNYDGTKNFAEVVREAQKEGYTEPDPRLDLGGKDVMRKIMILAREAGEHLEMEDIENNSFMPEVCMKGSVEDFYAAMEKEEAHFKKLYEDATRQGKKLKFVASFENGKAAVGLKHIDPSNDFYHLYGKDNIVLFYTNRYVDQPMVIKGAGAGAEVTASGVFADILRTARA